MNYTKEQLNQINVHSLRILARDLGVKAPTSLIKQDLIDEILDIQNGNKQPYIPTDKGRPIKATLKRQTFEIDEMISIKQKIKLDCENKIKKAIIKSILKEIEKKLNEIL